MTSRFTTIDLSNFNLKSGELIDTLESDGEYIEVREINGIRWFHFSSPAIQSAMVIKRPEQLILPYSKTLLATFMFQQSPNKVLSLGLGGGAMERFFKHKLPQVSVRSIELSPLVIKVCRKYFNISHEEYDVICNDAEVYLAHNREIYETIYCDIFGQDGTPDCLTKTSFYQNLSKALSDDGIAAINLIMKDGAELLKILQAVYPHFDTMALLDVPEDKNIILFLSKRPPTPISEQDIDKLAKTFDVDMPLLQKLMRFIPNPKNQR